MPDTILPRPTRGNHSSSRNQLRQKRRPITKSEAKRALELCRTRHSHPRREAQKLGMQEDDLKMLWRSYGWSTDIRRESGLTARETIRQAKARE